MYMAPSEGKKNKRSSGGIRHVCYSKTSMIRVCNIRCGCADIINDNIRIILALRYVFLMVKIQIQSFYIIYKHTLKHFVDIQYTYKWQLLKIFRILLIPKGKFCFINTSGYFFRMPSASLAICLYQTRSTSYAICHLRLTGPPLKKKDLPDQEPLHRICHGQLSNWQQPADWHRQQPTCWPPTIGSVATYLPPIGGANVRLLDLLIADVWRYQIFSY
jgi:hypothetical protein